MRGKIPHAYELFVLNTNYGILTIWLASYGGQTPHALPYVAAGLRLGHIGAEIPYSIVITWTP